MPNLRPECDYEKGLRNGIELALFHWRCCNAFKREWNSMCFVHPTPDNGEEFNDGFKQGIWCVFWCYLVVTKPDAAFTDFNKYIQAYAMKVHNVGILGNIFADIDKAHNTNAARTGTIRGIQGAVLVWQHNPHDCDKQIQSLSATPCDVTRHSTFDLMQYKTAFDLAVALVHRVAQVDATNPSGNLWP